MIRAFARRISIVLVCGLTLLWLALNQTLAPGHIVLGLMLAVLVAWASSTLRPLHARLRRLDQVPVLFGVVLADVVRSNFHVARIVLGWTGARPVNSGFLDVPLELRDPHGLAALAVILTATPGTVWVALSPDGSWLRIHVLDLVGEQYWIRHIKDRYERRLRSIFE
jgi:multicomponent K+:H+ antiporter subunit E